jgi:hypothetical protein
MGILNRETECCGASFENNNISTLGLLLISIPYTAVYFILFPIIFFLNKSNPLSVIFNANLTLIKSANILPNLKCKVSAKLYNVSPRLSGLTFKFFNLAVLYIIWMAIISACAGVSFLWDLI